MTGTSKRLLLVQRAAGWCEGGRRQGDELPLELPTEGVSSRLGRNLPPIKGREYRILNPVFY